MVRCVFRDQREDDLEQEQEQRDQGELDGEVQLDALTFPRRGSGGAGAAGMVVGRRRNRSCG